jgi:hypothetical protein
LPCSSDRTIGPACSSRRFNRNVEINAGLADPKIKARFADLGSTVFPTSPAEFGKFIADETEKWGKVVKFGPGGRLPRCCGP